MTPQELQRLRQIGSQFEIKGELAEAHRVKIGHINETFAVTYRNAGLTQRYIHQTINTGVFKEPVPLMQNVVKVTEHIRQRLREEGLKDLDRRALQVIACCDGQPFYVDEDGRFWRTFVFIENARTYEAVETPAQAFQASLAFGHFQSLLSDLSSRDLAITIPDFHHTRKRFLRLQKAIAEDPCNRAGLAARAIGFALAQEPLVDVLLDAHARGEIPERVTHNDTKFNNVMLDLQTGEAMCVVDLDTVMPGMVLYDFGDMVRTTTSRTAEDETYLDRVELEMELFEPLVRGYIEATRSFLTPQERSYLVVSGALITFTIGIRFLTDYLEGDHYFRVHRQDHNLDRCRKQFKLVQSIQDNSERMQQLVDKL
ncbi:MAG: aminoglycoside phosphotransferase family protein [Verrucomicrobia bacterium]|nr:aminoglycoside phosphotransferase family protein [Verrucomicrobiota bacterium]